MCVVVGWFSVRYGELGGLSMVFWVPLCGSV